MEVLETSCCLRSNRRSSNNRLTSTSCEMIVRPRFVVSSHRTIKAPCSSSGAVTRTSCRRSKPARLLALLLPLLAMFPFISPHVLLWSRVSFADTRLHIRVHTSCILAWSLLSRPRGGLRTSLLLLLMVAQYSVTWKRSTPVLEHATKYVAFAFALKYGENLTQIGENPYEGSL